MTLFLFFLCLLSTGVVLWRVLCVGYKVSPKAFIQYHQRWRWWSFAASYVALFAGVLFGTANFIYTGNIPLLLMILASAGVILFDPRRPLS